MRCRLVRPRAAPTIWAERCSTPTAVRVIYRDGQPALLTHRPRPASFSEKLTAPARCLGAMQGFWTGNGQVSACLPGVGLAGHGQGSWAGLLRWSRSWRMQPPWLPCCLAAWGLTACPARTTALPLNSDHTPRSPATFRALPTGSATGEQALCTASGQQLWQRHALLSSICWLQRAGTAQGVSSSSSLLGLCQNCLACSAPAQPPYKAPRQRPPTPTPARPPPPPPPPPCRPVSSLVIGTKTYTKQELFNALYLAKSGSNCVSPVPLQEPSRATRQLSRCVRTSPVQAPAAAMRQLQPGARDTSPAQPLRPQPAPVPACPPAPLPRSTAT